MLCWLVLLSNGAFNANELNFHPLDLFIDKPIDAETKGWAVGGRFDFMFDTDAPYTQARGDWDSRLIGDNVFRFYKIAVHYLRFANTREARIDGLLRLGRILAY